MATTTFTGKVYYSEEEYNEKVNELEKRITDLNSILDMRTKTIETYKSEGMTIASALRQEAADRDWCELYNDFVDDLNGRLTLISLDRLTSEYEITVTVTRTQTQTFITTIEARNEDEAQECFEDDPEHHSSYQLLDNNWDDSDIHYEVEGVCAV